MEIMTRLNLVPPELINNKQLFAEYREIPRILGHVIKHAKLGKRLTDYKIPEKFCLNRGHETFFYDKCLYVFSRWLLIRVELVSRGFLLGRKFQWLVQARYNRICREHPEYVGDPFYPSYEDLYLSMARLVRRSRFISVREELRR